MIYYIHGANSTSTSFNYIKKSLPTHRFMDVEYDCNKPLASVVKQLADHIDKSNEPIDLIGHSLGGVISVALTLRCPNIRKVVTIASPLGGSTQAAFLRYVIPSQMLNDVQPYSATMNDIRRGKIEKPILSFVTTAGGTDLINEKNDGVVAVSSQKSISGPVYVEVHKNHFEVLLTDMVCDGIKDFIFEGVS